MTPLPVLFVAGALLAGCSKGAPPEAARPRAFALAYTGNLDGEIEPCG